MCHHRSNIWACGHEVYVGRDDCKYRKRITELEKRMLSPDDSRIPILEAKCNKKGTVSIGRKDIPCIKYKCAEIFATENGFMTDGS